VRRELFPSTAFARTVKRLAKKDRTALASIRSTLSILQEDAFDPRLGSHKLKGDLAGLWACSAGYDRRIVFEILKRNHQEIILLVSAGAHDEVY
jgi:mRNA-degrading endonuclease YafQ of YafQ-DinJ toxin-antitoxin module